MSFLNLPQWRKFQESTGRKSFDLGAGYMIKLDVPLGKSYLYSNYPDALEYLEEIKNIGRAEGAIFFKWEPLVQQQATNNLPAPSPPAGRAGLRQAGKRQGLSRLGFVKSSKELQPQKTIVLDLKESEEKLLGQMGQKTRYNLRVAQKRGVEAVLSKNKQTDFNMWWSLILDTALRDKFSTHTKDYYKKLLDMDIARLYIAYKDGKLASAAIVVFAGNTATYLHGASDYKLRKHMAPYLMHWKIIRDAKRESLGYYDLWGINEKKWPGLTRFKKGFGGKEVKYLGSFDLPISRFWYILYRIKNIL
ncbi:MAG: peptidoglycan bridge formation glycyltransferase FemA/FemB family protein [Candidatus Spechtbacterales bacterium]